MRARDAKTEKERSKLLRAAAGCKPLIQGADLCAAAPPIGWLVLPIANQSATAAPLFGAKQLMHLLEPFSFASRR